MIRILLTVSLLAAAFALSPTARHTARAQAAPPSCPTGDTADAVFPAGESDHTLRYDGLERFFRVYRPATLPDDRPAALVFVLHGFAGSAVQQQSYSGWGATADEHGFIVVYPQGTGFPLRWNSAADFNRDETTDDVGFLRAVVAAVQAGACTDPARVYITGLSNGGGMSYRAACEAADVFAAWGGVAGAYPTVPCPMTRPVPAMLFHGTADGVVPYEGDESVVFGQTNRLPPIPAFARAIAAENGCTAESTPTPVPETDGTVTEVRYTECDGTPSADVVFYTLVNGGHTWPNGTRELPFLGETNRLIDPNALLWAFFAAHPHPAPGEA